MEKKPSQKKRTERLEYLATQVHSIFPLFFRKLFRIDAHDKCITPVTTRFQVLGMLTRVDSLPMSEIGRRLAVSKPNMTAFIDRFIDEGLVDRRHDEKDRRLVNVSLTEQGRAYFAVLQKTMRNQLVTRLSVLTDGETDELTAALEKVHAILSRLSDECKST